MATRRMIANRAMRYGGKVLSAGDEFKASRQDARVLEAIGRAAGPPTQPAQPTQPTQPTPPTQPAQPTQPTPPTPSPKPAPERETPAPAPAEPEPEAEPEAEVDDQEGDAMPEQASTRARALTKAQLAAEYANATGGKPDGRWNKNRLEQELEAVRGTYRRRDMRADG